ncbi:non-ribosomal peptide synthetase [Streptomyces sp. bgisy027]|uniref:non-ribosomal peptide synthetase n=1 Tax=Streptomyces sp. bgisy027 TaxID=3413770 RepID=UPI003D72835D
MDFPLSQQQRRIWTARQLDPGSDVFNVPVAYEVTGPVDDEAFDRAVRTVARRHNALLLEIDDSADSDPRQRLGAVPARVVRVTSCAADEVCTAVGEAACAPFTNTGPRFRVQLFRSAPGSAVLLFVFDHLVMDALSVSVFLRDLAEEYASDGRSAADGDAEPRSPGFADYVEWQQRRFADPAVEADARKYWETYLHDLREINSPPSVGSTHRTQRIAKASAPVRIPEGVAARSARLKCTPFALHMAAFAVVLRHFLRSEDVLLTYPAADPQRIELELVVGPFTDLLVYRSPGLADATLLDFARDVHGALMESMDHRGAPLDAMWEQVRAANPADGLRGAAMVSLTDTDDDFSLARTVTRKLPLDTRDGKADLLLDLHDADGRVTGRLEFNTALYDEQTARSLADAFHEVLVQLLEEPATPAAAVRLMDRTALTQVVADWGAPEPALPYAPLHQAFVARAQAAPERTALRYEGTEIGYGELDARTRTLAARLTALGLSPGSPVALCLPRSPEYVIAAMAVLRSGLAFLPVDTEQPVRRRGFVIADAKARAVVVRTRDDVTGTAQDLPVIALDELTAADAESALDPAPVRDTDTAYVITTSGSTGLPKAVAVPHRAIANNIAWKIRDFGFTDQDRFYFKTPPVFDASLWEYLTPLALGAEIVIAPDWAHRDPRHLLHEMRKHRVTVAQFVPTLLKSVLAEQEAAPPDSLRRVFAGGESLDPAVVEAVRSVWGCEVVNLYGPTEAAIETTAHHCRPTDTGPRMPIGRPVPGARVFVLGAGDQPLPAGFVGELCVGGTPLALGYVSRPELTAERFVTLPLTDGEDLRVYRTGDLARWTADGELEYFGREDSQVKLHGIRVELDEIRRLALGHPDVDDVAVVVRRDRDDAVVAYLTGSEGLEGAAVRAYLAERLPAALVPAQVVRLDALPVTASGKLDTRALPTPAAGDTVTVSEAPRTVLESRLAALWAEVLGTTPDRVPRDTSLFELGGSSLSLVRLHRRIREEISPSLAVTDLFKYPTVAAVAKAVAADRAEETS